MEAVHGKHGALNPSEFINIVQSNTEYSLRDTEQKLLLINLHERGAAMEELNELTGKIIAAAIEVHKHLGPGLLESAYEECMSYELGKGGLLVKRQVPVPITYKEIALDCGYRIDTLVDVRVILENKSVDML
ncbi:MAG: GxxExxY protein, partial [Bacteroidota bacterium]